MSESGADRVYPVEDERPHPYGEDPYWQESVVLFWWDEQHGLGGYTRIGHEPHFDGGTAHLFNFVCTADGQLPQSRECPTARLRSLEG